MIPALCEADTIGALLTALRRQDHAGRIEVIVVDGGSTDGTREVVRRQFPEVRLLRHEPAGTSTQRNRGAAAASYDILVFLDADNRPGPRFLARLARVVQTKPFAAACPWFVPGTRSPVLHLIYFVFNGLFFLSQWRIPTGAGMCIVTPRRVFEAVGGFDESLHLGEDVQFLQRAARHGSGGRHRHLLIPLRVSARRFESYGVWPTLRFYIHISRYLLSGAFAELQKLPYGSARPQAKPPRRRRR